MRNDSIDNFRIELNKPSLRGSFYVRQGDTRARTIHITITDNGKIVDLSDAKICELLIKKPDNNQNDQTMVRVGNELQYTLRTQDINVAGECLCQVMVTFKDGTFLTTPTFSVMVYQKEVDQNLEKSTNEYTALSAIILDVEGTQAEINTYVDEKTNEITEIATTATTAATNASASATAASNSADDAEDQADAAARSASDCATYASNCAGLAANCASYLDDVTGIAATKINKVNGEAEGILNIKNGDVTFTDIVGNASNVVSTRASINDCNTKASNAVTTSNNALSKANQAYTFAYSANNNASTAKDISNRTKNKVNIVSGFVGSDIGYSNLPYTVQAGKILDQNGAVVNGSGRVLEMVVGSENVYIERVDLRIVPDGTDARSIAFYKADGTLIGEAEYYETFIDCDEYFSPISEYVKETTLPVPTNAKYLKIAASTSGQAKIFTQDNMSDAVKELQNRPSSITTTSTSPLPNCSASSIVGIDVDGCSTQNVSANLVDTANNTNSPFYVGHYYLNPSGSFSANSNFNLFRIAVSPSTTYYVANSKGTQLESAGLMRLEDSSKTLIEVKSGFSTSGFTFTTTSATNYVSFSIPISREYELVVAKGSSAIPYSAYTGSPSPDNPIPIVDASGDVTAKSGIELNGGFEQGGIAHTTNANYDANKVSNTTRIRIANLMPTVSGQTYKLTCNSAYMVIVQSFDSNGLLVDTSGTNTWNNPLTVTASAYMGIAIRKADNSNISPSEIGNVALMVVGGASNKITLPTLRSVGNVKDELIVNADGSGQIVKRIGVFTPTACWSVGTDANNGNHCAITLPSNIINDKVNVTVIADKLVGKSYNTRNSDVNIGRIYPNNTESRADFIWVQLAKGDTTFTDTTSATTFVKTLNIYYQLATPTTTTLTASEVSAIRQLQTYSGTTIIDSALDVKSVTYHADTKAYIDGRTDYSYSDTIIGKWADGKPLHRMVIETTTPSSTALASVTNAITSNTAELKRIDGVVKGTTTAQIPINCYINDSYHCGTWLDASGICMSVTSAYTSKPCEIIAEYTLTDESTQSDDGIAVLSEGGDE